VQGHSAIVTALGARQAREVEEKKGLETVVKQANQNSWLDAQAENFKQRGGGGGGGDHSFLSRLY